MASTTLDKSTLFIWTPVRKACAILLAVLFALCLLCTMDAQTIFVQDEYIGTLATYTQIGTCIGILAGLVLAWAKHQTFQLPNLFYAACGYLLVIILSGTVGGVAIFGTVPRASLLFSKTELSVAEDLYQVRAEKPRRRVIPRAINRAIWNLKYDSSTIYSLRFFAPLDTPFFEKQRIHATNHLGLQVFPVSGWFGEPYPVLLHGVGNSFAIRVQDFSVVDRSDT